MIHELNIFTNDGWVVTLISDKEIDLGDVILSSIIVQPVKDHEKRVDQIPPSARDYKEYRLRRKS